MEKPTKLEKLLRDAYLTSGSIRIAEIAKVREYVRSISDEKLYTDIQKITNNKLLNLLLNVGLDAKAQIIFLATYAKNGVEEEAKKNG